MGVAAVLVGYCRVSTFDQVAGFEAQVRELTGARCKRIFKEQVSSVGQRPELEAAIDFVREADVLIVTKLDRLARSIRDLWTNH
jgi:DNA invertase Pin-like site-specific DNA recombinase